jgi:Ca2+-binding EF-hand superfamily protein
MTINLFDANGDGEIQFIEFKKIFEDLERERMKIK